MTNTQTPNISEKETVKRLVAILKAEHPNLPLADDAILEIKSELAHEYDNDVSESVIYTFTNAVFYKNSIVKGKYKYSKDGQPTSIISEDEKSATITELERVKNEAYKIVKELRSRKIKTPLSPYALNGLERNLIIRENIEPAVAKKAIYSFKNSISYQKSIMKQSNKFFYDLNGNITDTVISDDLRKNAKEKWSRFNSIHNPWK